MSSKVFPINIEGQSWDGKSRGHDSSYCKSIILLSLADESGKQNANLK
jgi:hypothetical protein